MGDVGAFEQDEAAARPERAGDQIDEAGLAGAVGADKRVARAGQQAEIDVARHGERAEALAQRLGLERGGFAGHCPPSRRRSSRSATPSAPPRANITTSISGSLIQTYQ